MSRVQLHPIKHNTRGSNFFHFGFRGGSNFFRFDFRGGQTFFGRPHVQFCTHPRQINNDHSLRRHTGNPPPKKSAKKGYFFMFFCDVPVQVDARSSDIGISLDLGISSYVFAWRNGLCIARDFLEFVSDLHSFFTIQPITRMLTQWRDIR